MSLVIPGLFHFLLGTATILAASMLSQDLDMLCLGTNISTKALAFQLQRVHSPGVPALGML